MNQLLAAHMGNLGSLILSIPLMFYRGEKEMAFRETKSIFIPFWKGLGNEQMESSILQLGFLGE